MPRITFKDAIALFEKLRKTNTVEEIAEMELEIKHNQLYAKQQKEKEMTRWYTKTNLKTL